MTLSNKELGALGEEIALKHLLKKGYIYIGKNIRLFCGEIDLLMKDKNTYVLVEVKNKSDDSYGTASDMITLKKKHKLIMLAKALEEKTESSDIRIDVVAIDNNKIDHMIAAVEEGDL